MTLSNHIDEYGGKLGTLKYLRDTFPDLKQHILDCILIQHDEDLSKKKVKDMYGFPHSVLARGSHKGDWDGMVDTIPTKELKIPFKFFGKKKALIDILSQEYREPASYSKRYDIKDVTLGLCQYVRHELWTVTEHPNEKDRMYFDMCVQGRSLFRAEYELIGDDFHSLMDYPTSKTDEKVALELVRKIRNKNIFDENDRLQYEIGIDPFNHPYLFQVRKFSHSFESYSPHIQKLLNNHEVNDTTRLFGNLHYVGKKMKIINEYNEDIPAHGELIYTGKTPFRIPSEIEDRVKVVAADKGLLSHGLTGPAQTVLKNNGLVLAGTYITREKFGKVSVDGNYINLS